MLHVLEFIIDVNSQLRNHALRDIARTSPKGCSSRIWTFYRGPPSEPRERTSNFVILQGPPPELRGCLRSLSPPLAIHLDRCVIRWNAHLPWKEWGGGGGLHKPLLLSTSPKFADICRAQKQRYSHEVWYLKFLETTGPDKSVQAFSSPCFWPSIVVFGVRINPVLIYSKWVV